MWSQITILFTPFRISNAQMHHKLSLKTLPKVGVLSDKWCKKKYAKSVGMKQL